MNKVMVTLLIIVGVIFSTFAIIVWKDQAAIALSSNLSSNNPNASLNPAQQEASTQNEICFSTEIIDLTNDVGQNYYVNYRIKREQFRQESKDMLQLLLESDIRQTREQAQERWLVLSNKISQEREIENVLKMRGFEDAVSEVNIGGVVITILAERLTVAEIDQIKNITGNITGCSREKIEVGTRF